MRSHLTLRGGGKQRISRRGQGDYQLIPNQQRSSVGEFKKKAVTEGRRRIMLLQPSFQSLWVHVFLTFTESKLFTIHLSDLTPEAGGSYYRADNFLALCQGTQMCHKWG